MARTLFLLSALVGLLGIALGAFGAHALGPWAQQFADGADRVSHWKTAADYHQTLSVLAVALCLWAPPEPTQERWRIRAVVLVLCGIGLFSGSLYAMALSGVRGLGAVTPLGGLAFMGAFAALMVAAWRQPRGSAAG